MTKRSFNLRNMVKTVAILTVTSMMFLGCNNDDKNKDNGKTNDCATLSWENLKKAAQDGGIYSTETAYFEGWEAIDGFTIIYKDKYGGTKHNVVLRYKDKAAADAWAKKELNSGTKIPIQNCNFLTFAWAIAGELQDEQEKKFLEDFMNGKSFTVPH